MRMVSRNAEKETDGPAPDRGICAPRDSILPVDYSYTERCLASSGETAVCLVVKVVPFVTPSLSRRDGSSGAFDGQIAVDGCLKTFHKAECRVFRLAVGAKTEECLLSSSLII